MSDKIDFKEIKGMNIYNYYGNKIYETSIQFDRGKEDRKEILNKGKIELSIKHSNWRYGYMMETVYKEDAMFYDKYGNPYKSNEIQNIK